jgi:hypothetical protein
MKINLPNSLRWNGREIPVEGAMERALKGEGNGSVPEPEQVQTPAGNAPDLKGYVFVPAVGIYVAKNRDLNGLNWNQATDKIYNQGISVAGQRAEMPTPAEFMTYVKYLLSGSIAGLPESERKGIIDDILKTGEYRGNWLNANFIKSNGHRNLGIEMFTFDTSGKPVKKSEPLEQCLEKNDWADINSGNKQGLLTKASSNKSYEQGKNVYFWAPVEGYVAWFGAYSDGAVLLCSGHPGYSGPSLGVRLVVRPKGVSQK